MFVYLFIYLYIYSYFYIKRQVCLKTYRQSDSCQSERSFGVVVRRFNLCKFGYKAIGFACRDWIPTGIFTMVTSF